MTKAERYMRTRRARAALEICVVLILAGCESKADMERDAIDQYAVKSAEACRSAMANIVMVENARDIGDKPKAYAEGRAWANDVCRESVKAQEKQIQRLKKNLGAPPA